MAALRASAVVAVGQRRLAGHGARSFACLTLEDMLADGTESYTMRLTVASRAPAWHDTQRGLTATAPFRPGNLKFSRSWNWLMGWGIPHSQQA